LLADIYYQFFDKTARIFSTCGHIGRLLLAVTVAHMPVITVGIAVFNGWHISNTRESLSSTLKKNNESSNH